MGNIGDPSASQEDAVNTNNPDRDLAIFKPVVVGALNALKSDSYRTFLELAPGFSSFARSASIAEVRGNIPLATQFWNDAIDVTKDDEPADSAWARVQLGNLRFLTGDTDGARTQFETALKIYPDYAAAQAARARSYAADGELDRAATLYAGLVARIPQPDYVIAYGEVLDALGRKGDAQKQYALVNAIEQLYVSLGVKNDLPLVNFRLDHGTPAEMPAVLVAAEAAYAGRPSISGADTLAWALYRNGRLDDAAAKSAEAMSQGTKDPAILFHSAAIANARDDRATSQRDARELATLNTNYSLVHRDEIAALFKSLGVSE